MSRVHRINRHFLKCILVVIFITGLFGYGAYGQANLCGPECLYVALLSLKPEASPSRFKEFQKQLPVVEKSGYSMATLHDVALRNGLNANLLRFSSEELVRYVKHNLVIVRIAVDGGHHFVLCEGYDGTNFRMFDSTLQRHLMDRFRLEKKWEGESLVLSIGEPRLDSAWSYRWVFWGLAVLDISISSYFFLACRWRGNAFTIVLLSLCIGCSDKRQFATSTDSDASLTVVGSSSIDLGKIEGSASMVATFRLRNDSSKDVAIDNVRTSCSCAHATISPPLVPPTGVCEVKLHVDPMKTSVLEATATVLGGGKAIPLKVVWQFSDFLRPSIQKFPILYAGAGEAISSTFPLEGDHVKLVTVESMIDPINKDVEIKHNAILDSGVCSLNLNVGQSVQHGVYYGVVDVVLSENAKPMLRIPWSVRVVAPVVVSPKEVVFVGLDESENATAQLLIETDNPAILEGACDAANSESPEHVCQYEKNIW